MSKRYQTFVDFKRRRLRISRIDGQTRKIENPDNLPEEHLWGTIFENVFVIFQEGIVFEKFAKNENPVFTSLNMQKLQVKFAKFSIFVLAQFAMV